MASFKKESQTTNLHNAAKAVLSSTPMTKWPGWENVSEPWLRASSGLLFFVALYDNQCVFFLMCVFDDEIFFCKS